MECIIKTAKVFKKLFGSSALPRNVSYENLYSQGGYACYEPYQDIVKFNLEQPCFLNKKNLNKDSKSKRRFLEPNKASAIHPAHIFVHEFAHAAHFKHLRDIVYDPFKYWEETRNTTIPSPFGRLISKYKLSDYTMISNDMAEFLAERIAQDICNAMDKKTWELKKIPDVDYGTIFDRKWSKHNACPQAYIDYFTQLVWQGQTKGAESLAKQVDKFLERKRGLAALLKRIDGTIEEVVLEEPKKQFVFDTVDIAKSTYQAQQTVKEVKTSFWQNLFNFNTNIEERLSLKKNNKDKQLGY